MTSAILRFTTLVLAIIVLGSTAPSQQMPSRHRTERGNAGSTAATVVPGKKRKSAPRSKIKSKAP